MYTATLPAAIVYRGCGYCMLWRGCISDSINGVMGSVVALGSVVLALLAFQTDGEVLGALEDLSHAVVHQFLLFDEFFRLGVFAELYGLDQDVLELVRQTVGGLDLDVGVADAHEVGDELGEGGVRWCRWC